MKDGEPITGHLQKMQRYVDHLLKLNMNFPEELAIDIILHSLPSCFDQFRMTYHMNKEEHTLSKLQGLLKTVESGLKGKSVVTTPTPTATPVLEIGQGKGKKREALRRAPMEIPLMDPFQVEPRKILSLLLPTLKRLNASIATKNRTGRKTTQSTYNM